MNPLLEAFEVPPFHLIKTGHFEEAINEALNEAYTEIGAIADLHEEANFANTIEALEFAGMGLNRVSNILFNLHSAETNDDLELVVQEASPKLAKFGNDVLLNPKLFSRVKSVYDRRHEELLTNEQLRLLEKTFKSFVRNGALLSEGDQEKLRELDQLLSLESVYFGQAVLKSTNAFHLHITTDELAGMPESAIKAATEEAKARNYKHGGVITLQQPSYVPAMTYLKNRELREKLFLAFNSRAYNQEDNNQERVFKIAQYRHQRAQLLGYPSHAHFVLEERMAEKPEKVMEFMQDLLQKAGPFAKQELAELEHLAHEDGLESLQKWDVAYYAEKHKQARFALESEKLKPYFLLENVVDGIFKVAYNLYGLQFIERPDIPVYHKDVNVFEVKDGDRHMALLYLDFFPRQGKRAGAWMTSFREQHILNGEEKRPLVSIVCNFTPPSLEHPSLLGFEEVTTLFHEFGHALHGILAEGSYASINGTNVFWDFVELPSQILENWCYEAECLSLFARHYKTREALPQLEVERIKAASAHMEAFQTLRQLGFAFLDMAWHNQEPVVQDLESFENGILGSIDPLPKPSQTSVSCAFSHIFQGGYSAAYYSYKWAEVLDADAFERFKEEGIFNSQVAADFRRLLSLGGQVHPAELYRAFRGRDAQNLALLKRAKLVASH